MSLINRILPMGVFGIVLAIILLNTMWMSGIAVGVETHYNTSVTLDERQHEILSEQPNVTQDVYSNVTIEQRQAFKSAYGFSLGTMINAMFLYVNGGMELGYQYPGVGRVLVRYQLPVILPVWSYLIIKHRTIMRAARFIKGSIK